jgi:type IV secretion system T-DNA border endonuclease VirD2
VAEGTAAFPSFAAKGTQSWQEKRCDYCEAVSALQVTGEAEDVKLASDVRVFLAAHFDMNATPEVFAARHAEMQAAERQKTQVSPPEPPQPDRERGR